MTTPHPYRLRPYHNPQRADESKVPEGWRMLYADEFPLKYRHRIPCRVFVRNFMDASEVFFHERETASGRYALITYIVPVSA
jgi:hypothetical protein